MVPSEWGEGATGGAGSERGVFFLGSRRPLFGVFLGVVPCATKPFVVFSPWRMICGRRRDELENARARKAWGLWGLKRQR